MLEFYVTNRGIEFTGSFKVVVEIDKDDERLDLMDIENVELYYENRWLGKGKTERKENKYTVSFPGLYFKSSRDDEVKILRMVSGKYERRLLVRLEPLRILTVV